MCKERLLHLVKGPLIGLPGIEGESRGYIGGNGPENRKVSLFHHRWRCKNNEMCAVVAVSFVLRCALCSCILRVEYEDVQRLAGSNVLGVKMGSM